VTPGQSAGPAGRPEWPERHRQPHGGAEWSEKRHTRRVTAAERRPGAREIRVEWNEAGGYQEAQVWAAVEALAGTPLREHQ